ncbi:PREDICTED: disintegrin and metalloproteinase domain-containing protein 8 isoform X3 [Hipposideros armiger]|uniref:Disintegrin and metalloproteinase domain-containing protein 8 isoform X3 n=1 Tax=Hipposideros armiger TaxID=186990 RepID=A0A8B7RF43_HIPAR|nr:PREDICTED: disintegrin and metalloproteinase domain-containing protein 8 isoform X3 [Hipposideros armiger]
MMSAHRGQKAGRGTSGELQAAGPGTSWTNALGGALCTQQDLWPVPQEAGGHVPPPDPSPHSMSQVTSSPRRLASHLPPCGAASSSLLHGGEAEMQGGVRMGPCASLRSFIQPTCIKRTWSRRPQGTRRSPRNPEEQPDQGEATRGGRGAHPKVSQTPPLPASRANWGVRGWPGRGAWESRAPGLDRARRAALPHALRPRTPGSQILDRTPRLRISDPHPRLRTPGPWIPVRAPRLLTADPHPRRAMRRLRLWLLGALWLQVVTPRGPLPHVEQYEVVWPQRLPGPRTRRALPSHLGLYPDNVSYVLEARGHTFTLHLRKNRDLVRSGYTETYTAANGSQVTEQLQKQDHCFYQGHVEGHPHSAASLSTCDGLRGFFRAGEAIHLIEPLHGGSEGGQHALYQAQHLRQKVGTCGVSNASLESILGPRTSAAIRPRNRPLSQETRYVELYVVTDRTLFRQQGSREAVRKRVLEVVNHVDKLYQELKFRVVLVGLDIWNQEDKIHISSEASTTLDNFLAWRERSLVGRHPHDNAQLITGVDFTGNTVGLAKVSAMCSQDSGAVNQDHSHSPIGVACTMAHEMGHNLGMDHDEEVHGCYCPVPQNSGGCIMAAKIGSAFPRRFSQCSRADLETFVEKPYITCMANAPDLDRLVGGPVCGNGFVERGEQCDCGQPQDCQNRCCNATTCRLLEGAECAHGTCCHECRVKPAGTLCRAAKDVCDLEEYCDGRQPACPEDAFQENGTPCLGGYCYDGTCPTLAQRCQDLWGPGTRAAVETCYSYSISSDCSSRMPLGSRSVNRCGVLFCQGGQKPRERSACTLTSSSAVCQALVLSGGSGFEPVLEGTKCGEERVCWKGLCEDLRVYRAENCSAKCSGHGVMPGCPPGV